MPHEQGRLAYIDWRKAMIAPRYLTMTVIALAGATALQACGGGKEANTSGNATSTNTPPAESAAATTAATSGNSTATAGAAQPMPATGATVKVQMLGDAKGYREDPLNVTVKVGGAVQWTNVSGGPHNVSFWPDSIPAGTADQLGANMPAQTASGPAQKLGPLVGPLLTQPNDTYTISFAGLKPGVYKYYCTPHLALGMRGSVTVQ
jgi:plastocyanin